MNLAAAGPPQLNSIPALSRSRPGDKGGWLDGKAAQEEGSRQPGLPQPLASMPEISNSSAPGGLSTMITAMREHTVAPLMERLLSPGQIRRTPGDDIKELNEEDVWGVDVRAWQDEVSTSTSGEGRQGGSRRIFSPAKDAAVVKFLQRRSWIGSDSEMTRWRIDGDIGDRAWSRRASLLSPSRGLAEIPAQGERPGRLGSRAIRLVMSPQDQNQPPWRMSAPVAVPDWSKLGLGKGNGSDGPEDESSGEEEGEGVRRGRKDAVVPPHMMVAQQCAQNRLVFSVHEGIGRTLKGRDASRVRNAVWRETGLFDEP